MNNAPERDWLDKNHGAIEWKLKSPDIHNPFDASVNEAKLEELIADRSMVMEACQIVAIMDETEILRINDLTRLVAVSEHPNLVNIDAESLDGYMRDKGVWDVIEDKINSFRVECQNELDKRRGS